MNADREQGSTLARRSPWLLAGTILVSLLGHGLAAGFLGCQLGTWIHLQHARSGQRPPRSATETWIVGRAVTVTMVICALGAAWHGR